MAYDTESYYTPLKSFQHCRKDTYLVCFQVPDVCPLCLRGTATTEFRIPPYILPSCFTSSKSSPKTIVLKPTDGDFIRNYVQTCHLHIGISDSNGNVFNFDEKGLKLDPPWEECLTVSLASPCIDDLWDAALRDVVKNNTDLWDKERYHHDNWNCFDFVLYFINTLSHLDESLSSLQTMTKAEFCDNFLTQKTKRAEQHIHLYRQVLSQGCVPVQNL